MQIKNFHTISDITFLPFTVFPGKFNLPQGKRNLNSSVTNFVYELPNNLRLRILRKKKGKNKSQNWAETQASAQSSLQKLIFNNSGEILRKSRYQSFLDFSNIP